MPVPLLHTSTFILSLSLSASPFDRETNQTSAADVRRLFACVLASLGWHICPKYVACHFCIPDSYLTCEPKRHHKTWAGLGPFLSPWGVVGVWLSRRAVCNPCLPGSPLRLVTGGFPYCTVPKETGTRRAPNDGGLELPRTISCALRVSHPNPK